MPKHKRTGNGIGTITNPLTGRQIQVGGKTHLKLLKVIATIDDVFQEDMQSGGNPKVSKTTASSYNLSPNPRQQLNIANNIGKPIKGKVAQQSVKDSADFYEGLLTKTLKLNVPVVTAAAASKDSDKINIPESKYNLISSAMPPNPEQHSWYHHHAPFSQTFGDYVCLKKSTLQELGMFLKDSLMSDLVT